MSNINNPNLGQNEETIAEKPETVHARNLALISKRLGESFPNAGQLATLVIRLAVMLDPDEASLMGLNIFEIANLFPEDEVKSEDERKIKARDLVVSLKYELTRAYPEKIDTKTFDDLRDICDEITK